MARLLYSTLASLDGYIEDSDGGFGWAAPDEEVHAFVNDLMRPVATHLYGRRLYETMAPWETDESLARQSDIGRDFAEIWQDAEKIVYSTTLQTVSTRRTTIKSTFDVDDLRLLKSSATGDLVIGGANLAAEAFRAGVVDEIHLLVVPVLVGGGKRALPEGCTTTLELLDQRRFSASGVVYLRYGLRPDHLTG